MVVRMLGLVDFFTSLFIVHVGQFWCHCFIKGKGEGKPEILLFKQQTTIMKEKIVSGKDRLL